LVPTPETRLTLEEIKAHPWYQQVNVREYVGIYVGRNPIPVDTHIFELINEYEKVDE
jgi:hypothetical protein